MENVPRNIFIPDPAGHGAEVLERQHVALQERLLGLGGERDWTARPEHNSRITNIYSFSSTPAICE